MIIVEDYEAIRRAYYLEKKSIRQIAREQHHSRKKDAPSGTGLKLKDVVSKHVAVGDIAATRAGNIPGTHRVGFDGPADQIFLEHTARSREGFASGMLSISQARRDPRFSE